MSDEKEQTVTIPVSEYLELLKHKPDGESSLAVRNDSDSSWRLIETAPMDGTRILASDGGIVEIFHYESDMMMPWRFGDQGNDARAVTHWMPLPECPTADISRLADKERGRQEGLNG